MEDESLSNTLLSISYECVVCVCEREREREVKEMEGGRDERERERSNKNTKIEITFLLHSSLTRFFPHPQAPQNNKNESEY